MISDKFLALVIVLNIENPKQNNGECYGKHEMTDIYFFFLSKIC